MVQNEIQDEIAVRQRRVSQRRCRKRQFQRLVCCLLPVSVFLFLFVVCIAAFLPTKDKLVEPSIVNVSAFDKPTQNNPMQTTPEPSTIPQPIAVDTWKLLLVNPWNSLPENYSIQMVTLKNGLQVDERCYPDLQAMMDACRADGLSPVICSAYRTWEKQEQLYQNKVGQFLAQGYPQSETETEAGKVVAVPGTSEHQLGLALDVVDINNQHLDETQESTEVQKWLMEHSWEYGFILRYPKDKSEITGIIYEPWHYRYVGREDAEQIHTLGVCLEEYLEGTF